MTGRRERGGGGENESKVEDVEEENGYGQRQQDWEETEGGSGWTEA